MELPALIPKLWHTILPVSAPGQPSDLIIERSALGLLPPNKLLNRLS